MRIFTDQLNRNIEIPDFPERIISLIPSQTELLFDLGLGDRVIGLTKFCIHPEIWFRTKQRVGGTKDFKIDLIHSLNPDLILANKEENTEEGLNELMKYFPVWISDIENLDDALSMIKEVGAITNSENSSQNIIKEISDNFNSLSDYVNNNRLEKNKVSYLIWQNPFISIGSDTFISDMLQRCGLENIFSDRSRYPEVSIDELKRSDLLFLSSEPFPFKQKNKEAMEELLPDTKIMLVDGEFFSWYGSRLINAPSYLQSLLESVKNGN